MSTKQELAELNKKFDVLISLMTAQQQPKPSIECKEVAVAPVKKKRGRPPKQKFAIVTEELPITPQPVVEKKVHLVVKPLMNIAGKEYYGNEYVSEGIATQLRNMMQKWEAYEQKTQQFIDHGLRDHGVM